MYKRTVKKALRHIGWDLTRYNPANSISAQLLATIDHAMVNTVFDIGANVGQFASELRTAGFAGKMVSFEPLSSAHEQLVNRASGDSAWIVCPRTAVGDRQGVIEINVSGNSVSSSVLPMLEAHSAAAVGSGYIQSEMVPINTLDNLSVGYINTDTRLFLKIDTQGFEWQVLDGAKDTLGITRGVLCELSLVPLYEGQKLWREIIDRLEAEGFMLWALQKGFTDRRTGQSLQVDAIFLRRELPRA